MIITPIYKFVLDNGTTITTYQDYIETSSVIISQTEMVALSAEENKILTNGQIYTSCIFVDSADGWYEIDMPSAGVD